MDDPQNESDVEEDIQGEREVLETVKEENDENGDEVDDVETEEEDDDEEENEEEDEEEEIEEEDEEKEIEEEDEEEEEIEEEEDDDDEEEKEEEDKDEEENEEEDEDEEENEEEDEEEEIEEEDEEDEEIEEEDEEIEEEDEEEEEIAGKADDDEEEENEEKDEEEEIEEEEKDDDVEREEEEDDEEKRNDDPGLSKLHLAAKRGNTELVRSLLMSSANVNVHDTNQNTPLHYATINGHTEVVTLLLNRKASVNSINLFRQTPLHMASKNGHTTIVKILLDNTATVDFPEQSEETPFYLAAKNGHPEVVDLLIQGKVCDFVLTYGRRYQTPLHLAVKKGHTKVVKVILKHNCRFSPKAVREGQRLKKEINNFIQTNCGKHPTELSNWTSENVSAVARVSKKGTPLELWENSSGIIPLEYAIFMGKPQIVQLLLNESHCEYSEEHLDKSFNRVLLSTSKMGELFAEITQALINRSTFNVDCDNNEDGKTPLHHVLDLRIRRIHMCGVMQLLLEKGADFNWQDVRGKTPLMIASEHGYYKAIQILFDYEHKSEMKLDIDARDLFGETALIKAAERNHVEVVRLLLSHKPKPSVNLHDYYGFTALHAAIYESTQNLFDMQYFSKKLRKRDVKTINSTEHDINLAKAIAQRNKIFEHDEKKTQNRKEIVKLLLKNSEIRVNAIDFRGNSPGDLAVKSSKESDSVICEALKTRRAVCARKLLQPVEAKEIDERGRNPLHRLILSRILYADNEIQRDADCNLFGERLELMDHAFRIRPDKFRHLATATDDKERAPLHYAVMLPTDIHGQPSDLMKGILELGSNVNAVDMYGKTPLHYAEADKHYKLLLLHKANEISDDRYGHTPKYLRQLRESVKKREKKLPSELRKFFTLESHTDCVNDLTEKNLVDSIRSYSQSIRSQGSLQAVVWDVWRKQKLYCFNSHLKQLKPLVLNVMERLADGISKKDLRFQCQPTLVGSAYEETQIEISADFDFNFKLIKFSRLCDPESYSLLHKEYYQLKRKSSGNGESRSDEKFDNFFNSDHYLLTKEVNSMFQILLEEVLSEVIFWKDEEHFELDKIYEYRIKYKQPVGLCKTVRLKMLHPIEDREFGFLFRDISIDIAACVHVDGLWPEDNTLADVINAFVKALGCRPTLIFASFSSLSPSSGCTQFDTLVRISFAAMESRLIKEGSSSLKAAYMVCKRMLTLQRKTNYQLKNCLLYCMWASDVRDGNETNIEDKITRKELYYGVEKIMFCFREFNRCESFLCYFMPSYAQPIYFEPKNLDYNLC